MARRGPAIVVNPQHGPKRPAPADHPCRHHWMLDANSFGRCRDCGAERQFVRSGFQVPAFSDRRGGDGPN